MKYKISELARLLNVSTNTIRRYEGYGHIASCRDEHNGYRIYDKGDVTKLMSIRKLRKYGFTHHDILKMKEFSLNDLIESYDNQIYLMEEEVTYKNSLKQRLSDDLILLKKVRDQKDKMYLRQCIDYSYVLYQTDDKLLMEEKRIQKVHEFLYLAPKVQMIYIIRKEDIEQNHFVVNMGWAMKVKDMTENRVTENEYTELYPSRVTLISIVKVPIIANYLNESKSKIIYDLMLSDTLSYMKNQNYTLDGDILGVKVATSVEERESHEYVLMNIPIKTNL